MPRKKTRRVTGRPPPARRRLRNLLQSPLRLWNAQVSGMRRTAAIGFFIGVTLGCLFGKMMDFLPTGTEKGKPAAISVNQRTGRPQLHIKGKKEIE